VTFVQAANTPDGASGGAGAWTTSVTLTQPVAAGDFLAVMVVCYGRGSSAVDFTISDGVNPDAKWRGPVGKSFNDDMAGYVAWYYLPNSLASASLTITATNPTTNSNPPNLAIGVMVFRGVSSLSPLDANAGSATAFGVDSNVIDAGSTPGPTQAGELIVFGFDQQTTNWSALTPDASLTIPADGVINHGTEGMGYILKSSAGIQDHTITLSELPASGTTWNASMIVFVPGP
jgi:hypothetical protein